MTLQILKKVKSLGDETVNFFHAFNVFLFIYFTDNVAS